MALRPIFDIKMRTVAHDLRGVAFATNTSNKLKRCDTWNWCDSPGIKHELPFLWKKINGNYCVGRARYDTLFNILCLF